MIETSLIFCIISFFLSTLVGLYFIYSWGENNRKNLLSYADFCDNKLSEYQAHIDLLQSEQKAIKDTINLMWKLYNIDVFELDRLKLDYMNHMRNNYHVDLKYNMNKVDFSPSKELELEKLKISVRDRAQILKLPEKIEEVQGF